jgi:hypothetical protein
VDDLTPASLPECESRKEFAHALLFTGHMIDRIDRKHPRFPPNAEGSARSALRAAITAMTWAHTGTTVGLAGGASGGDILFHESCQELGIPTRVLLGLPPDEFEQSSVAPAGEKWVLRFRSLLGQSMPEPHIMPRDHSLLEGSAQNAWQRTNLWMIEEATRLASEVALLALWDGNAGDGPGGTGHFIQAARLSGIRVLPIMMENILRGVDLPQ